MLLHFKKGVVYTTKISLNIYILTDYCMHMWYSEHSQKLFDRGGVVSRWARHNFCVVMV